jgi:hypothetical protein
MLRHKRLMKVIDTDTYFANEKSIGGYHCVQVMYGSEFGTNLVGKNLIIYNFCMD